MNAAGIIYLDSADDLSVHQLRGGFWVGWPNPPSAETHLRLLRNSAVILLAQDTSTGEIVGFITAVSDGVLSAYIPFLEVLPAWQGRGIGGELVERLLTRLRQLYMIDLLCDVPLQPYYARHGMTPATGMAIRNYDRQSGATQ
jgi:ribosomal protein S18 acetylase RimI-like enzyme